MIQQLFVVKRMCSESTPYPLPTHTLRGLVSLSFSPHLSHLPTRTTETLRVGVMWVKGKNNCSGVIPVPYHDPRDLSNGRKDRELG